ncbi:carbohydrate porin [Roseimarinus sediminis]|uniref:carbohydrate porin n=1 Tax=Roseimarinus sediminis TaxID=1610899 RepID=UPI003D1A2195
MSLFRSGFFIVLLLLLVTTARSQQQPGSYEHLLQNKLDSMQLELSKLREELDTLKNEVNYSRVEVDDLLSVFKEGDVASASMETRSKRKRVDALLNVISQQPGRLNFNGGATSVFQGLCVNQENWDEHLSGSFDIFAHTSFGKGAILFIDMEAIGGEGPDAAHPTFSGLNDDAGSTRAPDGVDRLTILEAWSEFSIFKGVIVVTAGKIDQTNYFDINAAANDETTQFLSSAFVNNASFAVPSNSAGLRMRTTLLNRYHFQFGLSGIETPGVDNFYKIYKIGSLGWTFMPGSEFEANFRVYAYDYPLEEEAYGGGVSFDKVIFGAYNLFARYGLNNDPMTAFWGIKYSWSAGASFVRDILGKPFAIGMAYGEQHTGKQEHSTEQIAELYFRAQFNQWIHLSPHVQRVWNANGSADRFLVLGLRTHFNF